MNKYHVGWKESSKRKSKKNTSVVLGPITLEPQITYEKVSAAMAQPLDESTHCMYCLQFVQADHLPRYRLVHYNGRAFRCHEECIERNNDLGADNLGMGSELLPF